MTFEDHLDDFRDEDGNYDLAGAEQARAKELTNDPGAIGRLAAKAAATERRAWETRNSEQLRKQFGQAALSPELDLDVLVPLGGSKAVRLGDMYRQRIRDRVDLRTDSHVRENEAFNAEIKFWRETDALLADDDVTVAESVR